MPAGRPAIPAEIQRAVRFEAGERCAICGETSALDFAHIIPWKDCQKHEQKNLILLCAVCHRRADDQKWGPLTLNPYKEQPWVLRSKSKRDLVTIIIPNLDLAAFGPNGERKVMETLQSVFGIDVQTVLFRALEQGSVIITLELNRTDTTWLANQKPLLDWCLTQIGNGWEIREWPSVFANEDSPDGVLVRIVGKGSFHNSPALKSYVTAKLDEGRRDFVIDLNNCPKVDSTFVGTLMGIALHSARHGGRIWLIRQNPQVHETMESLGLLHVFASSPVPKVFDSTTPLELFAEKASIRQTMIDAHEAIIEVSPQNAELFRGVIEQLKVSVLRPVQ